MNLKDQINKLSYEELFELNQMVVARIREMRAAKNSLEIRQFNIGNPVQFRTAEGELISGIVVKKNKKTIGIVTEDGERWNVSPSFLTLVTKTETASDEQQVIDFREERNG